MGLLRNLSKAAAKFVVQEVSGSALSKIGEHLGDAVGNLLAKKIDKNHGQPPIAPPPTDGDHSEEKPQE